MKWPISTWKFKKTLPYNCSLNAHNKVISTWFSWVLVNKSACLALIFSYPLRGKRPVIQCVISEAYYVIKGQQKSQCSFLNVTLFALHKTDSSVNMTQWFVSLKFKASISLYLGHYTGPTSLIRSCIKWFDFFSLFDAYSTHETLSHNTILFV